MAEDRYNGIHLARWNGERDKTLLCPGCGKRLCFKEYVYADGSPLDPVNHMAGKCDHGNSCGYHLPPREWFQQHPEHSRLVRSYDAPQPLKKLKRIEIAPEMVKATRQMYDKNTFVQWLRTLPWSPQQKELINIAINGYALGTSRDGGVIFWQIDYDYKVRTGKKMLYNPKTGKRLKKADGTSIGFNWIHSILQNQGQMKYDDGWELKQTLFGMHLAHLYPECSLHIVESEKTAVLMSALDPEAWTKHIWLATGGLNNLKLEPMRPILDRELVLYPDANGVEQWREKMQQMCLKAKLSTKWIDNIIDGDGQGADIADVCLRRMMMSDDALLQELRVKHPQIDRLVRELDLRPF